MSKTTTIIIATLFITTLSFIGFFSLQLTQANHKPQEQPPEENSPTVTIGETINEPTATIQPHVLGTLNRSTMKNEYDVDVAAESAVVMDAQTGEILYGKNSTKQRPVASLTKLMSALVYLDTTNQTIPEVPTTILPEEYTIGGTLNVERTEELTTKDLFNLMLVGSVNNATNALARMTKLPKEEFISRMNQKAETLNLTQTTFTDPTGLDTTNLSTAEEITVIAKKAFDNETIRSASAQKAYEFSFLHTDREKVIKNTNELLSTKDHIDWTASKTGYLNEAGWCVVTKLNHEDREFIITILGGTSKPAHFYDTLILVDALQQHIIE